MGEARIRKNYSTPSEAVTREEITDALIHWQGYIYAEGVDPFDGELYFQIVDVRNSIYMRFNLLPHVARKIKMLASPHYRTLVKAYHARRSK